MRFSKQCCSGLPFPSLGDLSRHRNWTRVSCIGMWILYHWATWRAHPNRQWVKSQSVFPCITLWTHRPQLRRGRRPESGEKNTVSWSPFQIFLWTRNYLIIAINVLRPGVDIKSALSLNFIHLSLLLITHTHTHTHTLTHMHAHTQLSNLPCRDFSLLGKLNYAWKSDFSFIWQ